MQRREPAVRERRSRHLRRKGRRENERRQVGDDNDSDDEDGGRGPITTPITLTITRVIPPTSTSVLSTLPTFTTTESIVTPPSSTISSVTSTPSPVPPLTTSAPVPSVVVATTSSQSSSSASGINAPDNSGAIGARTLPTGAIVGIVIAVVLALLAATVFVVRNQYRKSRKARRTTMNLAWVGTGAAAGGTSRGPDAEKAAGVTSPGVTFTRAQANALADPYPLPVSVPPPPPTTYNNSLFSPSALPMPLSSSGGSDSVVKFTFIPTLPDELSISNGETVTVLQEYDDGWALCRNGRGQQGMVPLECLDRGIEQPVANADQLGVREVRNSRRASSLNVAAAVRR